MSDAETADDGAGALGCPLTSVAWIAAGDHPRQRNRVEEAKQPRLARRSARRVSSGDTSSLPRNLRSATLSAAH